AFAPARRGPPPAGLRPAPLEPLALPARPDEPAANEAHDDDRPLRSLPLDAQPDVPRHAAALPWRRFSLRRPLGSRALAGARGARQPVGDRQGRALLGSELRG